MAINRAQLAKELEPGLNALFGLEYSRYEAEHAEIFETESSDRAFEEEVLLSGFGAAPTKAEGASVTFDTAQDAWTSRFNHQTVALGFSVSSEAMEDNLYEQLSTRYTKALARSMAPTTHATAANIFNNAFSSSYKGGDGVSLANTSHPLVSGGTFSNTFSTQVDLSETALENAVIAVNNFVDDRGLPIAITPRMLLIPFELQFVAERILKSQLRPATSDNDLNALNSMGMFSEGVEVNAFLSDTDAFFIKTDAPNGFKHFTRAALATGMEGDFDTGNMRYKARERYSFGFSDPRCVYGSQGS